jgi:glycogen debranching enzyme
MSPAEPAFEPHNYWRGPIWPVIDWLLWRALRLAGCGDRADEVRRDSLGQIAATGTFAEYFEPFTGEPLGSAQQSWTAAVALDWSAAR